MRNFSQTGDSMDLDAGIGFGRRRDRLISEILGMFEVRIYVSSAVRRKESATDGIR
jgi:hypothetical protein